MNKPTPEDYQRRLNALRENYLEDVRAIAAEMREDVIIPLCQKHDLVYGGGAHFYPRTIHNHAGYPYGYGAKSIRERYSLTETDKLFEMYEDLEKVQPYLDIQLDERDDPSDNPFTLTLREFVKEVKDLPEVTVRARPPGMH